MKPLWKEFDGTDITIEESPSPNFVLPPADTTFGSGSLLDQMCRGGVVLVDDLTRCPYDPRLFSAKKKESTDSDSEDGQQGR